MTDEHILEFERADASAVEEVEVSEPVYEHTEEPDEEEGITIEAETREEILPPAPAPAPRRQASIPQPAAAPSRSPTTPAETQSPGGTTSTSSPSNFSFSYSRRR